MAGLTDMEELVASVSDKDVADYLREALACYGSGAHRACIVLTHIALFDGLRRKVNALAPVNAVAKSVADQIEPLAAAQKVFELLLVQKLKSAGIINQLEAQILEQLNNQRNKAAHPSGHVVTAEEARFVFAEAINKFLSKPIRETSYVVDSVIGKLSGQNFFPSMMVPDLAAVVDQELANLDPAAKPFLMAKLVQAVESTDQITSSNARNFVIVLASKREALYRDLIITKLVEPKSADTTYAELLSSLVTCDPQLLTGLGAGTLLRMRTLLMTNAIAVGVNGPYQHLRNPAQILAVCIATLGEAFVLAQFPEYSTWVLARSPYAPEFVSAISASPTVLSELFDRYKANASSSQWSTSNPFASAAPALDSNLAASLNDERCFTIVSAIVRGAEWNGHGPQELANSAFNSLPALKAKAQVFAHTQPALAQAVLTGLGVTPPLAQVVATYLA